MNQISVIVPTYNRSALLREALASVRALEGPDLSVELIVVDNGSTDGSVEVAHEFGALVVACGRKGAAAARNVGVQVASSEFIAFLDDDDVFTPQHLRPHLDLLSMHPEWGGVVGQVVMVNNQLVPLAEPGPIDAPANGDAFAAFLHEYPQIGATVVRKHVFETVGYLDEDLLSDEDWDWHLRLALRHPVGFAAVPSVLFRQRPRGRTDEDQLEWMRLSFFRRVFWRNVRRAGSRRPEAWRVAHDYVRLSGRYFSYFLTSAVEHCAAGERASARSCIYKAVLASPPHALALRGRWPRTAAKSLGLP